MGVFFALVCKRKFEYFLGQSIIFDSAVLPQKVFQVFGLFAVGKFGVERVGVRSRMAAVQCGSDSGSY